MKQVFLTLIVLLGTAHSGAFSQTEEELFQLQLRWHRDRALDFVAHQKQEKSFEEKRKEARSQQLRVREKNLNQEEEARLVRVRSRVREKPFNDALEDERQEKERAKQEKIYEEHRRVFVRNRERLRLKLDEGPRIDPFVEYEIYDR